MKSWKINNKGGYKIATPWRWKSCSFAKVWVNKYDPEDFINLNTKKSSILYNISSHSVLSQYACLEIYCDRKRHRYIMVRVLSEWTERFVWKFLVNF